jgi:hypothetical protein
LQRLQTLFPQPVHQPDNDAETDRQRSLWQGCWNLQRLLMAAADGTHLAGCSPAPGPADGPVVAAPVETPAAAPPAVTSIPLPPDANGECGCCSVGRRAAVGSGAAACCSAQLSATHSCVGELGMVSHRGCPCTEAFQPFTRLLTKSAPPDATAPSAVCTALACPVSCKLMTSEQMRSHAAAAPEHQTLKVLH